MTKCRLLILFIFFSSWVYADCQFADGDQMLTVKEGESLSLRSPGKSLETLKIQDQDGLNTCYANATSTILKSILPGQPDVSYTHAAIMGTTRGWQEDWNKENNKYLNKVQKDDNFTSFGWVCETVAGMRNAGGACPSKLSVTENKNLWDSDLQQRLFQGLGSYFDHMNLIKNDPAKMSSLKKDLSLAIEAINVEKVKLTEQCEKRKNTRFPLYEAVKYLFEDAYYEDITDSSKCSIAKTKALKRFLDPESKISKDRLHLIPSEEVIGHFFKMFEDNKLEAEGLDRFLSSSDNSENNEILISNIGNKLNSFLLKEIPDSEVKAACSQIPEGQSAYLKGEILDMTQSFIFQMKNNKDSPCKDLLYSHGLDDLLRPMNNTKSCLAPTNIDMILSAMKPLLDLEVPMNQSLLPTLLNPESRYANQIVKALMPGCMDKTKLISLDNVACGSFPFCDPKDKFDDNNTYSGPAGGCLGQDQAKKMMRTKSLKGINQGRALGVAVCTGFMYNPDIKTNFCKEGLEKGKSYNFHEMTITGYRCHSDKIEYEIVNSWGNRCEDNRNVECQKDEYDTPTGPFWVKEDALVDSTTDLNTITVKNK